ncbi:helix-turn-helix domain-containing protein [Magnetospirillum molischianum]|nr:helix-turn-helix transcriptional regulator [Magnetospirillum molischianum]
MADNQARNHSLPSVQDYLTKQIELSGAPQRQIAKDAGFSSPQMLSMIKKGDARLPMDKIEPLAIVLGVDPARFMQIWFNDYHPFYLRLIERSLGATMTDNEREILSFIREASGNTDPRLNEDVKHDLTKAFRRADQP